MKNDLLEIDTSQRRTVDLTDQVRAFCRGRGDGLCNVFVPHATAGIAVIETGAGSDADLVEALERLLPRGDRYRPAHGSPGSQPATSMTPPPRSPTVSSPATASYSIRARA